MEINFKEQSEEWQEGFIHGVKEAKHQLTTQQYKSAWDMQREKEERVIKCVLSVGAAYVIVGFLVFGWYHNHYPMVCEPVDRGYCDIGSHHAGNIAMSAIWPVRLVGEFAIFVTRWP